MAPRRVKGRKFEQESVEKALVSVLTINELPFSVVEQDKFRKTMETAFPGFHIPSPETISRVCAQLFMDEKLKLKSFINRTKQRVCLALDVWKSNQSVNYLCITAHFIDDNWNLHKKIISFSPICSDDGAEIGKMVEKCLQDWEISNVLAISAGDGSQYDAAVTYLGTKLLNPVLDGKFLRLKCLADLTNYLIKRVLKDYDRTIARVRTAIKYVAQSPSVTRKFKQLAIEHRILFDFSLSTDCPSRWMSTFEMLWAFEKYKTVFNWFGENDPYYIDELHHTCGGVLEYADWEKITSAIYFLETFYESTDNILESHVTSNMFLDRISTFAIHLDNWGGFSADIEREFSKAFDLRGKYASYWDYDNSNILIYVASILDPRCKTYAVEYYFRSCKYRCEYHEGEPVWVKQAELVVSIMCDLFNEYASEIRAPHQTANIQTSGYIPYYYRETKPEAYGETWNCVRVNLDCKTEIDIYLNDEEDFGDCDEFDILLWWKLNSERFPVLSKMAKEVLAIPISAFASESGFTIGCGLLDDFRSSFSPSMVEALVCTQDWLNKSKKKIPVEKSSTKLADGLLKGVYEQLKVAMSGRG